MKLVSAFLAGLIVACFAALIYVKETRFATPPAQEAAASPSTPPQLPEKAESTPETPAPVNDTQPDQPASVPAPKPIHREASQVRQKVRPKPLAAPKQVARNEPPPNPNVNPAPAADTPPSPAPIPPQVQQPEPAPVVPAPAVPPEQPPARQPMTVTLASGTTIAIRTAETLSTDHNYSGDTFRATLDQPIIKNGFIIADKNSKVLGHIIELDKPGRVKGTGELVLTLSEINTTDGQRVAINTENWTKQTPNNHSRDAEEIGGGAALGAIIGALAGGGKGAAVGAGAGGAAGTAVDVSTRGKQAIVPVETHLTFHLQSPVTITEKLN
ncbi:MAG: hypothetical protein WA324_31135 [Bryobacteraceae bacterium]